MRIALIGDSHSQVIFPALSKLLKSNGNSVVLQISKPGWDILSFQKDKSINLEASIVNSKPDIVVFSLGGNNQELKESYKSKLDWIINIARKSGAKRIIYSGPAKSIRADVEKRHLWTSDFIRRYARDNNIEFIDGYEYTKSGHNKDGVHFGSPVYRVWANAINDAINSRPDSSEITVKADLTVKPRKKKKKPNYIFYGASVSLAILAILGIKYIIDKRVSRIEGRSSKF